MSDTVDPRAAAVAVRTLPAADGGEGALCLHPRPAVCPDCGVAIVDVRGSASSLALTPAREPAPPAPATDAPPFVHRARGPVDAPPAPGDERVMLTGWIDRGPDCRERAVAATIDARAAARLNPDVRVVVVKVYTGEYGWLVFDEDGEILASDTRGPCETREEAERQASEAAAKRYRLPADEDAAPPTGARGGGG